MSLESFIYKETLNYSPSKKYIAVLGTIDGEPAIVSMDILMPALENPTSSIATTEIIESNDIYSWFSATLKDSRAKVSLTCPATELHIKKARAQRFALVTETPQQYREIVSPYIETMRGARLQWVENILHHGKEADRVVFRNDDFVLLPDMKWDGKSIDTLYLVAISIDPITSVRELTKSHIPFLKRCQNQILETTSSKYGVSKEHLKTYVHYQPSYYHFHIHVAHIDLDQNDFGRSILLNQIIAELEFAPYSERTITYKIGENHDLYESLKV